MKIDLVSEHASPLALLGGEDAGGQNVHVAELARALGRRDIDVVVHTRRDDPALPAVVAFAPNVVVHHVDAGPPEPILKDHLFGHMAAFAAELTRWWEVQRPDVVHSHFWMSGLATLDAARPLGIPVLHTFHALGSEKRLHQGCSDTSPLERIDVEADITRRADRLVATTAAEAQTLIAMGADPDRVEVVPCGVDLQRFYSDRRNRPAGPPRIVAAGRLVPRKGLAEVITALSLRPELADTELIVAGGPPEPLLDNDVEARHLIALAHRLGIDERVQFLGAVSRSEMPALLRSADVVVCCPWYEPFGLVAVEAMASGVPVVATRVGGLAETVVDGTTGTLVEPRNPASIADGLVTVLSDSDRRVAMAVASEARAKRYGWDDVAAETHAVAEAALNAATGPASRFKTDLTAPQISARPAVGRPPLSTAATATVTAGGRP